FTAADSKALAFFQDNSFLLGFAFRTSVDTSLVALTTSTTQGAGFDISVQSGLVTVSLNMNNAPNTVYTSVAKVTDGNWHRFGIDVTTGTSGTTVTPYLDGVAGKLIAVSVSYD